MTNKVKQWSKRFIAFLLCFAMTMSNVSYVAAANTTNADSGISDKELKAALAEDVELYPDGGFEFFISQLEGTEGDKKAELVIVRRGGTQQEATVDFKAVGISAGYGEDYLISVRESWLKNRVLESEIGTETLVENYVEADVNTQPEEQPEDAGTLQEEPEEQTAESKEETAAKASSGKSSLQMAKDLYLGTDSNQMNWQEIDEAHQKEAEEISEQRKEAEEVLAQNLPGVSYTCTFAPGEFKKVVTIDIIDDLVSETDEQVLFMLSNAQNAELAGTSTAYLNIKDNDENEKVIFAMAEDSVVVNRSEGVVKIKINRLSGEAKMASVTVGTGGVTAQAGTDYTSMKQEVFFMQGVTEQIVEIPLLENANAEPEMTFQVALDPETAYVQEAKAITTVTILTDDAAVEEGDLEAAAVPKDGVWETVFNGNKKVTGKKANTDAKLNILSGVELSTADSIRITWSSNEGSKTVEKSRTEGSGCDKKTVYYTETYTDRDTHIKVNGSDALSNRDPFSSKTQTYTLTDAQKVSNAKIDLWVYPNNGNDNASAYVTKIEVHYPQYQFTITNTPYEQTVNGVTYSNGYTEKVYTENIPQGKTSKTENGHRYYEGVSYSTLATAQFLQDGKTASDSVIAAKPTEIAVSHTYNKNVTTNGISVKGGYNGTVYFAGYQLLKKGATGTSSGSWSSLIQPQDLKLSREFLNTYKAYMHDGNEFKVRPVYYPYTAFVRFQNSDTKKGSYGNGIKTDEVIRCTYLDTFEVSGIANQGYSVDGFNLGAYEEKNVHKSSNSANTLKVEAEKIKNLSKTNYEKNSKTYAASSYTKVSIANSKWSKTLSNVITFTPNKEWVYLAPAYGVPDITVKANPILVKNDEKLADKDKTINKGVVVYSSGDQASEDNVLQGDYKNPLVVNGATLNQEYVFSALVEDGYRAFWQNYTADADGNGTISTAEQKLVENYNFVTAPSNGNAYSFRPVLPHSLIYYGFEVAPVNRYSGFVDGVVSLVTKPIFGAEEETIPINGAVISVAGKTTTTKYDKDFGGIDTKVAGGDGYYSISDKSFGVGDMVTVNVSYEGLNTSFAQTVNAAALPKLRADKTIQVHDATMYELDGNGNIAKTYPKVITALVASDKVYRLRLETVSDNASLAARKAKIRFYRNDGSHMSSLDKEVTSDNGIFVYDFNPATLQVPAGAYMTVQFFDQNGAGYYEHEMGFIFTAELGMVSFVNSFDFGGANAVIDLIGTIDSAFGFGWDGDMSDSEYVTESDGGKTRTLSFGFDFEYNTDDEDEDEDDNKGDDKEETKPGDDKEETKPGNDKEETKPDDDKKKQDAVKDAAKNTGNSSEEKKNRQDAANDAVDSSGKKNKSSAEVGVDGEIKLSFAIGMTMCVSDKEGHVGEWYFKDMMLCAKVEGGVDVEIEFVTPIGLPVMIGISVGGSGSATFVLEQNYDKTEYYFDSSDQKIDLFNADMDEADRAFNRYGIFNISPYVDLSAGVGFSFLNLGIGGRADFDMNFYTETGRKHQGDVDLSAYLKLKILFFEKKWTFASTSVNLFGEASAMGRLTEEDYRYESLATMEVSDRSYLEGRGSWNDGSDLSAQSIASTTGITETTLLENIYPNPDNQLVDLGDGKYLLVFVDDVTDRNEWNSTAVQYSVYDGSKWSVPAVIENDGTTDDAPSVFDLGERGIYVAWSTSDTVFDEEPGVIESLMSMNIHGALFDKTELTFGEVEAITKTVPYSYEDEDGLVADNTADVDPYVSYDAETGRMMMFYTKSEYESTAQDEEGLVGDAVNPYSAIAYRVYDFENGKWEDTYTAAEGVDEDYTKAWYGQRFLDLAPLVVVEETLDEQGFWVAEPVISEYVPATYEGADQDPIVTESNVSTFNGLALFTYVLDYDCNKETETDRDIFLQIYNYSEDSFTHPIMITSDAKAESNLRVVNNGLTTILAYMSDGAAVAYNLGYLVNHNLVKGTLKGQEFYYVDRTLPTEETTAAGKDAYVPAMRIAGITTEEKAAMKAEAAETGTIAEETAQVSGFDMAATEDYIYIFWTERKNVVKEGIEENTEEAAKAENRLAEAQLYGVRYDVEEGIMTEPVQVTESTGITYEAVDFVVQEGSAGKVTLVATAAESITETLENGEGETTSFAAADGVNKDLRVLEFTPTSTLTVESAEIAELTAGAENGVVMEFLNDGMETLKDLTFTATSDGTKLYEETFATEASEDGVLYGGRTRIISFPITLEEDAIGCEFDYQITDAEGNVLVSDTYKEEIPLQLDIIEFNAELTDRNTIAFSVNVTNNSRRNTGEQKISIMKNDSKELCSITTDSMKPATSEYFTVEYEFEKYKDIFRTYMTDTGNLVAETKFTAKTAGGEELTTDITLTETSEQRLRMGAIMDIQIVDTYSNDFKLDVDEVTKFDVAVDSIPYQSSRYEGMEDEEYNTDDAFGLRTVYKTDNPEVLELYDYGYAKGLKAGTAKVTAYIMPSNNQSIYDEEDGTLMVDNFTSLPDEAIEVREFTVTVGTQDVAAEGVKLNKSKASVAVGKTVTLKATVSPSDAADKAVTWKSSNTSVAKVKNGVVTGVKAGTATITAITANGKKATCKVTVNGISFNQKKMEVGVGESIKVLPTLSKGSTDKIKKVTYKTDKKSVATVKKYSDGSVKITAKKKGTATITVTTESGAKATFKVVVKAAPKKIEAVKKNVTLKKGKKTTLKYKLPANTASANVKFKSSNKKIVEVNEDGVVTAKKKGKATITITTFNKKKTKVVVTVK